MGMWEEEQICPVCGRPSRYGEKHKYCQKPWSMEGLSCFWAHEGISRKLISEAKYRYYYDYLGELLVNGLSFLDRPEFAKLREFLGTRPVVVGVPLHPRRLRERGFNQAEVIARQLSKRFEIFDLRLEVETGLLKRIRDTGKQVGRTREKRLEAMKGAFVVNSKFKHKNSNQIQNSKFQLTKNVLLVDDVWTTGATLSECVKVLKQAGVKQIWGLVLAR